MVKPVLNAQSTTMASSVLPPSILVLTLLPATAPSSTSSVISTTSVAVLLDPDRIAGPLVEFEVSSSKPGRSRPVLDLVTGPLIVATASEFTEVDDEALAVPATGRPRALVSLGGAGECVRGLDIEGVLAFDGLSFNFPDDTKDCL
jgi:hypothetical protein